VEAAFPGKNGKIAFVIDRDGNFEIYTMNPDGSNQTNITNNAAPDFGPAWSPDGTKIAFSSTRDGNSEIYKMNADGSNQTVLRDLHPGDTSDLAWSPDGTKIAFSSDRGGNSEIYTMNADGSGLTLVRDLYPEGDAEDTNPTWSPDSTKIAFEDYAGGEAGRDIHVMYADGSGPAPPGHIDYGDDDHDPVWSPDGTKIAFVSDQYPAGVYTMNTDGSLNPTSIGGDNDHNHLPGQLDWQPLPTNTAPTITSLRPPPGSSTTDRTPIVAATVTDQQTNLAKANITLLIDDETIPRTSYSYNRSTDRMSYTPQKKLSFGRHAIKVIARDGSGLSTTKRWSFEIVHP
jgi:hypothetical protein